MGASLCKSPVKVVNQAITGQGNELRVKEGRKVVMIVAFDYAPACYEVSPEESGLGELSCSVDGKNFAKLAKASGAEVYAFYDRPLPSSLGHPNKDDVVAKMKELASELGDDDMFVFFFSGHGVATNFEEIEEGETGATELCICDQSGAYNPLRDCEIADILKNDFAYDCDILFITDCCQSGTVCNLDDGDFADRPICHIAAVKDAQFAIDWGAGGGLTTCLVEAVEDAMEEEDHPDNALSLVKVFNASYEKFKRACDELGGSAAEQKFMFERTPELDPDSVEWPLVPPQGWHVNTLLDDEGIE
eukprot:TRINITY_DN11154_c0_g1_i1.p1 TRINITY_DN11154_c0_g1~~TRINITY_DN11154_c0_g1_i1.p1  ORF type:complete len:338 (-),score=84.65 TRINITY_DN11154_c0_g1_i1:192-1103(-)